MLKRSPIQKFTWKKGFNYARAKREWDQQFPLLSFHPPYVSLEDSAKLEQIQESRNRKNQSMKKQYASET